MLQSLWGWTGDGQMPQNLLVDVVDGVGRDRGCSDVLASASKFRPAEEDI